MKKTLVIPFMILAMALFAGFGCGRLRHPIRLEAKSSFQTGAFDAAAQEKLEALAGKARMAAQDQTQHAVKRASNQAATAGNKITVPQDYSTIQQAVDAAAPGDTIVVNSGTYNEFVCVGVPEIRIAAQGAVTVDGGFLVTANKIAVAHFKINVLANPAIGGSVGVGVMGGAGAEISGVEVCNNMITGGDVGIALLSSTACLVQSNHVSGASLLGGIILDEADGNKLDGNTATANKIAGIGLFPGCDTNRITNNQCDTNTGFGVVLSGNHNLFSRNRCNGNRVGILVHQASDNFIGRNNIADANHDTGLWLLAGTVNNTVQNNIFHHNTHRDIFDAGAGNNFFNE